MADELDDNGRLTDTERLALLMAATGKLIDVVEEQENSIGLLLGHVLCLVDQLDQLKGWLRHFDGSAPEALGTLYPLGDRRGAEIMVASQKAYGKPASEFLVAVAEGKVTEEMIAEERARQED